jgi:sporulation integral membrane protein YtvI
MPFFIAAILALITEPIIKFNMNKLKMSRRISSIIVIICTILIVLGITIWGGSTLVSKLIEYSKSLPNIITSITEKLDNAINNPADEIRQYLNEDVLKSISNALSNFVSNLGQYIQSVVSGLLKVVMSVPRIIVNVIITILAFVLFTKDRLNIIRILDFHIPENWIKKGIMIKKEVFSTLGNYLKIYSKILCITAIELLISFFILTLIGFRFGNIITLSILIAIVDILPILGIGTVLIPWAVWSLITGNIGFGIALLVIYIVLTIIRQIIEPKLVSNQLDFHPIITLLAMYAGFKMIGFTGLLLGPFALVILRCIYAEQIKKGFFKSFVE